MQPMKLLVIGTDVTIFSKGSEARARVDAYGRLFDELHVVIYTPPGFASETLSSGARLYPTNSRSFIRRPFDAARIGAAIIRERGIDGLSAQDPAESGLAGWLVKRKTGLPLHIQMHADFFSPNFRRNSWKERLRYWLAWFIVPRGDRFRVVSQRIKRSLESRIQNLESRITVLPIFVDRERFANAEPSFDLHRRYSQFDFIILMVSRLMREKNVGLALEAFRELLREFPKTGLVVVGDGPERKNLESRIQNLELTHAVRLEGRQDDLVSYYKTADLYLLTSNFEGYGRTAVEAAAAGTPIVMTDVGVAGDVIRDSETGRVVPVGDRAALAGALIGVRRDYADMRRMAEAAETEALSLEPRTGEEYLAEYRRSFSL